MIDPNTAAQHFERHEELRKTSPHMAGVYYSTYRVFIEAHRNAPDFATPTTNPNAPPRPATPTLDAIEMHKAGGRVLAAAGLQSANRWAIQQEQAALDAWRAAGGG